jgi:hypothetical protein
MRWLYVVAFVVAGCGGGETNQQVIDRYKPQFAQKREQWQAIARQLPAAGTTLPTPTPLKLDPRPLYDRSGGPCNTEIVMHEQLLDPDVNLARDGKFDLQLSDRLLLAMRWTGPQNPMSAGARQQRAGELCSAKAFEAALNTRYLVVMRLTALEKPQAVNEKTFRGGKLELEGFLVDLSSQELLGVVRVSAQPAKEGDYVWKESEDQQRRMEEWIGSSMWSDARKKTQAELTRLTGGTFNFESAR